MFSKKILQNPIFAIGVLFFIIFILDLNTRKGELFRREKFLANSCRATLVMLDKRIPETWQTNCEGDNLAITIESELNNSESSQSPLRKVLYKELANNLVFISQNSPEDSLQNVIIVRIRLISKNLDINAVTEGKYLVKYKNLKQTKFIAEHLKSTVQVQEVPKP